MKVEFRFGPTHVFQWHGTGTPLILLHGSGASFDALPLSGEDPPVALTVDTDEYPPKVLLVRGIADVELVDGILDEYLPTNQKRTDPEQFAQWEAEIRRLYKQMVRIEIRPTWAKVLDFETRIPSAVQELAEQAARHVE